MASLEIIGPGDIEIATAIMAEAYTRALQPPTRLSGIGKSTVRPYHLGKIGVCYDTSDLATRISHELGVFAAREIHPAGHALTSFGRPDAEPTDDDPIMCLTWGQFVKDNKYRKIVCENDRQANPGYFGLRGDVMSQLAISPDDYSHYYSTESVEYRQVTYTAPNTPFVKYWHWLNSSVESVIGGKHPVGAVDRSKYPAHMWGFSY